MAKLKETEVDGDLTINGALTVSALSGSLAPILYENSERDIVLGNNVYDKIILCNDIIPLSHNVRSLGAYDKSFADIFVNHINGESALVTDWQDVSLSAGWGRISDQLNILQYRRKGNEIILRGSIKKSQNYSGGETFATLPVYDSPNERNILCVLNSATGVQRIDIHPNGEMKLSSDVGASDSLFFDGVSFYII